MITGKQTLLAPVVTDSVKQGRFVDIPRRELTKRYIRCREASTLAEKLIDIDCYPVANVPELLLQGKSTEKYIIRATGTYREYGAGFTDDCEEHRRRLPDDKLLQHVSNKIVRNIRQTDGLKDTMPLGKAYDEFTQLTLFDMFEDVPNSDKNDPVAVPRRICGRRSKTPPEFMNLKKI